jgi:hypothetical protein
MSRYGWLVVVVTAVAVALAPSTAIAGNGEGSVHFFLGGKSLDSDDWGDLDNQSAFGVEMSWGNTDWPVSIATDLFVSGTVDDRPTDFDLIGVTSEIDIGVRKFFEIGRTRPYVGGGIAFGGGAVIFSCLDNFPFDCDDEDDQGNGVGAWLNGGVVWRLGKKFDIGFSLRWSTVDAGIFARDRDAGGFQYGLVLGWGWPKYE